MHTESISIPTTDDFLLGATLYHPSSGPTKTLTIIHSATAVPQKYYAPFAGFLVEQGYTVITYDYRGIGHSKPASLRGFKATISDWALLDMASVLDWAHTTYQPQRLFHIGHSFGGQVAGLLPNSHLIDAMATFSSQSGYWRLQGGNQKLMVGFHVFFSLPILSILFGYMPWSRFSAAEDLPKGVALEWSKWCRQRHYLLSDATLPLDRFQQFKAPVLAYSFADDKWGTRQAVDAMMSAYPNLTRRHIELADASLTSIGHFGFFRPKTKTLWPAVIDWLEEKVPQAHLAIEQN